MDNVDQISNVDGRVVKGFGQQWSKFHSANPDNAELREVFASYFAVFPWNELPSGAEGFDVGCGTGRWAYFVAQRVGQLHCIDASSAALEVARRNLSEFNNCDFHCASIDAIPLTDNSLDFGYCLGVLHYVPDAARGIEECARKLKPGAPFLIYVYYAFDNRPIWFRMIWRVSDLFRRLISALPFSIRSPLCELIAAFVYWPLARAAKLLEKAGMKVDSIPLSAYRGRSFYVMRTDALDRFGTQIEKRYTRQEIRKMMENAGMERITFSDSPCWCAVGYKAVPAN